MELTALGFYEQAAGRFLRFAARTEDLRAAFLVGSRAREDHTADEWSDMDVVLYTETPERYLNETEWLSEIGEVLCSFVCDTAGGDVERLTLFTGGYQMDFVVCPAEQLRSLAETGRTPAGFLRGVKVLVDKDGLAPGILPDGAGRPAGPPVTAESFAQTVNLFWFGALYLGKQLLRGELWTVKARDPDLKGALLQVMEWHAAEVRGVEDTWHAGRFLAEWTDPETWKALSGVFGHFERADSFRALEATMRLFYRLSEELGERMDYPLPQTLSESVIGWVAAHAGEEA